MNDQKNLSIPSQLLEIEKATKEVGFSMASDHQTGSLLRTLAASKRESHILELGTGTGLSTCWLLDGMDNHSKLVTMDNDARLVDIAKQHLSEDSRVEFHVMDGAEFLKSQVDQSYALIFADTWPGKYSELDLTLDLLELGGIYIIDDMLPQKGWPEDHFPKVSHLIEVLENRKGYQMTKLNWSTGIILLTKTL